jgi:hypothetical protein
MGKLPKTKEEIEQLFLAEMQTIADCEHALAAEVVSLGSDGDVAATWSVSCFNPGKSDSEACDSALQVIVRRLQPAYDIVRKH